jgi:predicted amidohydrolase
MEPVLRIALIQTSLVWEDPSQNRMLIAEKINAINQAVDLIVLPEMFTTGFTMQAKKFAEEISGETFEFLKKWAKEKDSVICGSFIMKENEHYYNRLIWMEPSGAYSFYDKQHLFRLSNEHLTYTNGAQKIIVQLKGWNICPMICYDLRFPVWCRNTVGTESYRGAYDVLLFVANWPERRALAWKTLLQARAIENQSYVVGLNRVGMDGNAIYHSGDSSVFGALGETICQEAHEEKTILVELNKEELIKTRRTYAFWKDADGFEFR